jgi:predicted nuclease of predicted toxin-antitoxin system
VDNQLPAALARFLCSRGLECQHVLDLGMDGANDSTIWEYAHTHRLVLITKDGDFIRLFAHGSKTVQVIWVRLGNCRNRTLIAAFQSIFDRLLERLRLGDELIEIR